MDNYLILLVMREDSRKASLLLRTIAKAVDFIIIATAISALDKVGYLAGTIYFLVSDGLFDGRSLGKKVMRLRVISVPAGTAGDFRDSIIRNTVFAAALLLYKIPLIGWVLALIIIILEFLLMLGNKDGMRAGDDLAGTKVIEG